MALSSSPISFCPCSCTLVVRAGVRAIPTGGLCLGVFGARKLRCQSCCPAVGTQGPLGLTVASSPHTSSSGERYVLTPLKTALSVPN